MEKVNVEAGLRGLSQSLQQIKALLAWQELEKGERKPGQPPSFRISSHVEEDLRNEYGFFVKMSLDIHEFLNQRQDSDEKHDEGQRQQWRQRLCRLDEEVRKLKIAERLLYPGGFTRAVECMRRWISRIM